MGFKRYATHLWQWGWLIILGTAVAGSAAFLVSQNTTPIYQSSTQLLIDDAIDNNSAGDSRLLLQQRLTLTALETAPTRPVFQETIERLTLPLTTEQLASMISVSTLENIPIIRIRVEDVSAERAALIANTVTQVFMEQTQAREQLRYAEPIANLQQRLAEVESDLETLQSQTNNWSDQEDTAEQAALSRLERQLNNAQSRQTETFNQLNDLLITQARESSRVILIEAAQPNLSPILPHTLMNIVLAAILGGLVTAGIVLLVENL